MAMAIAFLILILAAPVAVYGAEHTVGDTQGWSQGPDYATWASGQTFTVGDTLVFTFDGSHAVDEVSLADYNSCSSGNSIKRYNSSPTKLALSKAGPSYYICPTPGHCAGGMKLLVNVVAAGTPTPTPTTPAPPTSTTPPNNDSPPPPPPPPKISSPASSLNMNLVGVPLVLAALIAVIG